MKEINLLVVFVEILFEDTTVQDIYKELIADTWDAEYLDKNKYRIEIVDGVETKVRGKRMNKRARTNLCYVAGSGFKTRSHPEKENTVMK